MAGNPLRKGKIQLNEDKTDDLRKLIFIEDMIQRILVIEVLNQNGIIAIIKPIGLSSTIVYSASGEELYVKKTDYERAL